MQLRQMKVKVLSMSVLAAGLLGSVAANATVDPNFSTAMTTVQGNASDTISAAIPFIFTVVGALVILGISKRLLKKIG